MALMALSVAISFSSDLASWGVVGKARAKEQVMVECMNEVHACLHAHLRTHTHTHAMATLTAAVRMACNALSAAGACGLNAAGASAAPRPTP